VLSVARRTGWWPGAAARGAARLAAPDPGEPASALAVRAARGSPALPTPKAPEPVINGGAIWFGVVAWRPVSYPLISPLAPAAAPHSLTSANAQRHIRGNAGRIGPARSRALDRHEGRAGTAAARNPQSCVLATRRRGTLRLRPRQRVVKANAWRAGGVTPAEPPAQGRLVTTTGSSGPALPDPGRPPRLPTPSRFRTSVDPKLLEGKARSWANTITQIPSSAEQARPDSRRGRAGSSRTSSISTPRGVWPSVPIRVVTGWGPVASQRSASDGSGGDTRSAAARVPAVALLLAAGSSRSPCSSCPSGVVVCCRPDHGRLSPLVSAQRSRAFLVLGSGFRWRHWPSSNVARSVQTSREECATSPAGETTCTVTGGVARGFRGWWPCWPSGMRCCRVVASACSPPSATQNKPRACGCAEPVDALAMIRCACGCARPAARRSWLWLSPVVIVVVRWGGHRK
jgi:hypothetical protein